MNITIEFTEREDYFLRQFAAKQYEGAKDNLATRTPIHVVERAYKEFVADGSGEVWIDIDNESAGYQSLDDLIKARNEEGENLPEYAEVEYKDVNDVFICDEDDYIEAHGLNVISGREIICYEPIAFFLIRDEAVQYKDHYQKHNCNNCRIYTYGLGYNNYGDMPTFRQLLMRMGRALNEKGCGDVE